jgi:S1-C subfamily serine protease
MKSKREIFVATALAVALVGGGFAIGRDAQRPGAHANDTIAAPRPENGSLPSFADLATRVAPAVVNIKVTSVAKTDFPTNFRREFSLSRLPGADTPATPAVQTSGTDQDSSSAKTA